MLMRLSTWLRSGGPTGDQLLEKLEVAGPQPRLPSVPAFGGALGTQGAVQVYFTVAP
jgi:hypothetical protein